MCREPNHGVHRPLTYTHFIVTSSARETRNTAEMNITASFDNEGKIRVLEEEKFNQAEQLQNECTTFSGKLTEFTDTVDILVEVMTSQAKKIERAKLKAIGQRNKMESESENRKIQHNELRSVIDEKHAELERLRVEYDSLVKVEQEQKTLIEKLSNNEA